MPRTSLAVLPFLLAALPAQANEQSSEIPWNTDLGAARQIAAEKKAPLLVVFRCER